MGKKSMSGRKLTFLLITIPIVALFFCFNTLPLIKGVIYSFTNFKGYGSYDWVGLRNYKDLFTDSRVGGSYLFTFKLAINPNTIQRAYRELESEGYILSVAGKGSFVAQVDRLAEQQKKEALNAFRAAAQRLRALGLSAEALASLLTQEEPTDD